MEGGVASGFAPERILCTGANANVQEFLLHLLYTGGIMSTPLGVDILFLLFLPSSVRRPMSGVTHGFRSCKGKVLELLSPNLVCRLIGSVACLGLLLAVVPLLLTE